MAAPASAGCRRSTATAAPASAGRRLSTATTVSASVRYGCARVRRLPTIDRHNGVPLRLHPRPPVDGLLVWKAKTRSASARNLDNGCRPGATGAKPAPHITTGSTALPTIDHRPRARSHRLLDGPPRLRPLPSAASDRPPASRPLPSSTGNRPSRVRPLPPAAGARRPRARFCRLLDGPPRLRPLLPAVDDRPPRSEARPLSPAADC